MNLELNFAGNNNASGTMIDDKSKQWFGATVHSSGKDGIIVVCRHFGLLNFPRFGQEKNRHPERTRRGFWRSQCVMEKWV